MTMQLTDLDALERRAFSKFYEDGIFDLLLGLMMVIAGCSALIQEWFDSELVSLGVMIAAAIVLVGASMVVRARVVRPRLGDFRPRPERRRRITVTRLALVGSALLGAAVLAIFGIAGGTGTPPTAVETLLPVVWFVNATVVLGLMAYLLDVPRFFAYGVLFGLVGPVLIWPDVLWDVRVPPTLVFGILATPILVTGAWKLVRFMQTYPAREVPTPETDLGGR